MDFAEHVQALAETQIEFFEDVDPIPDLVTTLQDVIERLQDRWKQEFPGR